MHFTPKRSNDPYIARQVYTRKSGAQMDEYAYHSCCYRYATETERLFEKSCAPTKIRGVPPAREPYSCLLLGWWRSVSTPKLPLAGEVCLWHVQAPLAMHRLIQTR